jgi:hypothetical protein
MYQSRKATRITTSYIWRELTDEGRLVDPDDRAMFGKRLNSYGGYNSEGGSNECIFGTQ